MNSFSHLQRFRAPLVALCLSIGSVAFGVFPVPLTIEPGETGIVFVNGPPGGKGAISIHNIFVSPPGPGSPTAVDGKRTGSGSVPVEFLGGTPGQYTVSFLAKYSGQNVSGSAQIVVRDPATTSAQIPQIGIAGDPVSTSSGEYFGIEGIDLDLGGPMPLIFARYVGSNLAADGFAQGNLGTNRLHNFASRIEIPEENGTDFPNQRDVILPNGRRLSFQKSGTTWKLNSPLDVPFTLLESAGNFLLAHPHTQQIWTYNSDEPGKLIMIEDGRGNTHTLTYTGANLTGVSDGLGRSLTFTYASGRIATVTGNPGNRQITFTYTSGVLTSSTDQGGHTTNYGNSGGLPTSVTRPEGNVVFTQVYTTAKVTEQTERGTDTSTLAYGAGMTTFTDPIGETLVDSYNAQGRLTAHTDQAGNSVAMSYDTAGRRNSVTDRLGHTTSFTYHAATGLPATITNAEGGLTTFTYKSRKAGALIFNDLTKITYPDGSSRSMTFDAKGNVTKATDQAGKSWSFTYNARGQVLTAANPLGGIATYTYDDATGNLATSKDHDTQATTYTYDARNRLINIGHPGGGTIIIGYDAKDRITQITDERNNSYTYGYDTNNRLTTITDPATNATTLAYDALNRVQQVTDRLGKSCSVIYNSRRLIDSITDRNANTTAFVYDARQRLTHLTNPGGEDWATQFDDEGLLSGFSNPVDAPTAIKRNRMGQVVETIDPLNNISLISRDAMQRVIRTFDPLLRQVSFAYDKRGLLVSVTEQGTGTAKYTHDAWGALTKITDPNGGTWSYAYTKGGRLASVTDAAGKKTLHSYDSRGRLSLSTQADGTTATRSYDAASNLTGLTYSAGPAFVYAYDSLNRLTNGDGVIVSYDAESQITNAEQNNFDFGATYDDGGRLQTVSYLDGAVTVTYEYDTRDRLVRVTDDKTTAQVDFAYDAADRLTGITRSNGVNATLSYDAAGRLARIQEGSFIDLQYELNRAGEIVSIDYEAPALPAVSAAPAETFKYDKASRITNKDYLYDLLGRLTASPGKTFAWDGASRLTNANGAVLTYNGLGDLVTRAEGASTVRYYHHHAIDLEPIVYQDPETGGGNEVAYVWTPAGELLYAIDMVTSEVTFYHFDHAGSTLALTDDGGQVTDSYAYGPFGELLLKNGTSTQPFMYIGAWGVRAEGSLYHMRSRYYDPASARFLSRDSQPPDLTAPQTLNPYQYAVNNPLSFIDPEGTDRCGSIKRAGNDHLPRGKKKKKRRGRGGRNNGGSPQELVWNGLRITNGGGAADGTGSGCTPGTFLFKPSGCGSSLGRKFAEAVLAPSNAFPPLGGGDAGGICTSPPSAPSLGGNILGTDFFGGNDGFRGGVSVAVGELVPGLPGTVISGNQPGFPPAPGFFDTPGDGFHGGIFVAVANLDGLGNTLITGNSVGGNAPSPPAPAPAATPPPANGVPKGVDPRLSHFLAPEGTDPNAKDALSGAVGAPGFGAAPAR